MFFQTLKSRIFAAVMVGIFLTTVMVMYFVHHETTETVFEAHKKNAENLVGTLLLNIENANQSILFHKQTLLKLRKANMQSNVSLALLTVKKYHDKFTSNLLSEEEAKREAKEALRQLRYDNGTGYFWINTAELPRPEVVMHPILPELEGQRPDGPEFYSIKETNEHIFVYFSNIALKSGSGFVEYAWLKPDNKSKTRFQPKLSFISYFRPWNWVIGTGAYIDDIEKDSQQRLAAVIDELNTTIPQMRVAETGYMFIFNGNKDNLVHPVLRGTNSNQLFNPVTGKLIVDELIQAAHSESQTFEYLWDKPEDKGNFIYPKIAFMRYFEPLDWYIGSTIYYEEIKKPAYELNKQILMLSIVPFFLAFVLAILMARSITQPLKKLSNAVQQIEKEGINSANIPLGGTIETKKLGTIINKMIHSIQQTEQALKHSEEQFRILYSTADPTMLLDANKIIECNKASLDLLQLNSIKDLVGTSPAQHAPAVQPNGQKSNIMFNEMVNLCCMKKKHSFEWMYSHPEGGEFWAEIILTSVDFQDKNHLHCIWRDITSRKLVYEQLQKSEQNMRITLNSIGDAVITVSQDGNILEMNPVAERLTGWLITDAANQPLSQVLSLSDAITGEKIPGTVATNLDDFQINYFGNNTKLISKNNTTHLVTDTVAPIKNNGRTNEGVVLVFRDETEKVKTEKQLVHAQKMEAVGTLAGGLAHDFNNVLSGILGPVSLLEHSMDTKKECSLTTLSNYIGMIRHSGERAAEIVQRLLSISHKQDMTFVQLDVKQSLQHILKVAQNSFDKSITINDNYDSTTPAYIHADPTQIEQVFLNLMINSCHAMTIMRESESEWGGQLNLDITKIDIDNGLCEIHPDAVPQSYWMISISDSGVGITNTVLSNIFNPFFTTKDKGVGTGLGLTMVYNIIQQHGGFIVPYSEEGIGTVFKIYLPCADMNEVEDDADRIMADTPKGSGLILIVDDEPILLDITSAMLIENGYDVLTAKDGVEALEVFQDKHKELDGVLLDMVMPNLSGLETFKQMQVINSEVKVFLMSGFKHDHRVQSLLDRGVCKFIQKPFTINEISKVLYKQLF